MGIEEPVDKGFREEFVAADQDLYWLAEHGALAGVAEILCERRRQIERLGYTVERDEREHEDGFLVSEASAATTSAIVGVVEGISGPADVEHDLRQAGALCAAEIDRLNRMLTPDSGG